MRKRVNAAPSCRPAFMFVIRDNIAFAMPFTACAGRQSIADAEEVSPIVRPGDRARKPRGWRALTGAARPIWPRRLVWRSAYSCSVRREKAT
jgi:hypothetical protein